MHGQLCGVPVPSYGPTATLQVQTAVLKTTSAELRSAMAPQASTPAGEPGGAGFEPLKPAAEGGPPGVPGRGHQLPATPFE